MKRRNLLILVVLFCFLLLPSFADNDYSNYSNVYAGIKYKYIGNYDIQRLQKINTTEIANFSDYKIVYQQPQNSVKLYRVIYNTVIPELKNKPVLASGLIAIPEIKTTHFPVVSYQHGTVFEKTSVPSYPENSIETRLMLANLAGNGYIVIAPDYIGRGDSPVSDTFLLKDSTQQACFDMYLASKSVCRDMGIEFDELFLSGWSQGGWTSLIFLNKLENSGVKVSGCATAATPCDPYVQFNAWEFNPRAITPQWMLGVPILIINSYENYYGMNGLVDYAVKSQYRQTVKDLYKNSITWETASKNLPLKLNELLTNKFMSESSLLNNKFFEKLSLNNAYRWRFATKTRLYYGDADEVVYPYIATLPVDFQNFFNSAKSEKIFAGKEADHRKIFLFGIKDQKNWFDSIIKK